MANSTVEQSDTEATNINETLDCGIIMPIASMTGYPESHWTKVKDIIIEATSQVDGYKFSTKIVSETNGETHVIHKTIIQNLYNSEIVICDISGKNPNVLFELGMRLAFDKPTILIRDNETDFMFDTGVIEHMTYPKSLSYPEVVEFKKELAIKIKITLEKEKSDPNYSAFLRSFGTFEITKLDQTEISDANQIILSELKNVQKLLTSSQTKNHTKNKIIPSILKDVINKYISDTNDYDAPEIIQYKEEFIKYLEVNNITTESLPSGVLVPYIRKIQNDNNSLPF